MDYCLKTFKILLSSFIFSLLLIFSTSIVFAKTSQEIEKEIALKKTELEKINSGIVTLEKDIEAGKEKLKLVTGKREQLSIQISNLSKEKELIEQRLKDLDEQRILKELQKEESVKLQDEYITSAYLNWKETNWVKEFLASESESLVKIATYQATVAGEEQSNINNLGSEIIKLKSELQELAAKETQYKNELGDLTIQKQNVENELSSLDGKIKKNVGDIGNYRTKMGDVQSQIDQLTKEQKAIQEYERSLLKTAKNGGTKTIIKGEVYFQGIGREVYQGHGVGFSQFGAVGAALKGWDYKKILSLYYPNTKIIKYSERKDIKVDGYGTIGIEEYVAGAGEVPDYSCEDIDEKFDPNNVWKCWPEEAIKAQMVAFRTYGLNKTQGNTSICTSAKCQVYKGGDNKKWAAVATENEVVVYEGKPIEAFYSSDNNNGWGTADNDTVWSNFEGVGTPIPYLRAAKDSAVTFKYVYTDWSWRTNSYTIEKIDKILEWSESSKEASQSYKDYVKSVRLKIGNLQNLEFERDPSGRVKRVKLSGNKGATYMAGWLFKSIWNIYIGNVMPSGEADYIYSLTYYMKQG
ncbi:hypothetical protein KBD45_04290 [Candidatus Dojkabacteria bacterium]|nr:hypothetical protein [Candidatus Dojkabacteria bacterium]